MKKVTLPPQLRNGVNKIFHPYSVHFNQYVLLDAWLSGHDKSDFALRSLWRASSSIGLVSMGDPNAVRAIQRLVSDAADTKKSSEGKGQSKASRKDRLALAKK